MTSVAAGFVLMVGSCSLLFAQNSEAYAKCIRQASTQAAINVCANEEAVRTDTELNDIYRTLLAAAGNPEGAAAKITAAERAWIGYRDAYIDAKYPSEDKQAAYGSVFPMEVNLLRAKLTRVQIDAIRDLLKQYGGSK